MKTKYLSLIIICLMICTNACKKSDLAVTSPSKLADVYVAGTIVAKSGNFVAAYWKNGAIIKLTDSLTTSFANGIAVHGSDVYMAGAAGAKAVYWKNGVATILNTNGLTNSLAYSIVFKGDDMYVVGYANNNTYPSTAMYWKNGVLTPLPNASGNSIARAIAISGNDVYVAGYTSNGIAYWKNDGSPVVINTPLTSTFDVSSIAVNGADVYVAGTLNNEAAFWKNGVATVAASGGRVTGITTNGTDLLMAGTTTNGVGRGGFATYWKNNTPAQLSSDASFASAISLNGPDVYIAGGTYSINPANGTNENQVCYYWKNGVPVQLSAGGGVNIDISSIAVVPH